MNDLFLPYPATPHLPQPLPCHQVAKGECDKRHSWGYLCGIDRPVLSFVFSILSILQTLTGFLILFSMFKRLRFRGGWTVWQPSVACSMASCDVRGTQPSPCYLRALALLPSLTVHHQLFRYYKILGKRYWYICLLVSLIIDDDLMKYFLHCACESNCQNKSQQVVFLNPGRTLHAILCGKYRGSGF